MHEEQTPLSAGDLLQVSSRRALFKPQVPNFGHMLLRVSGGRGRGAGRGGGGR